ncbi:helix-turn-helix domain-containing protein, partial [Vibrio neptunius]
MDSFEGINEFVAVAESQGFSSAAKQLGCSTSHVSRQVSRLEERV